MKPNFLSRGISLLLFALSLLSTLPALSGHNISLQDTPSGRYKPGLSMSLDLKMINQFKDTHLN